MKRVMMLLGALLLLAGRGGAQVPLSQQSYVHRQGNVFYSLGYSNWYTEILSGNAASGSAQITVVAMPAGAGGVVLQDGTTLPLQTIFNTSVPILIQDANAETVTPTAVSVGSCPAGNLGVGGSATCAFITATFASTHGQSALVTSGDQGIQEAITDAGNQGGGLVFWQGDTGIVTLLTSGLTTTTALKVPTNFYNAGAACKVTTTITTSANWAVGISGATAIFCSANSTLTAGTTGLANQVAPASTGTTSALTAVLFTMGTSNPGAGAIKARVWGWTPVQATN